MQHLQHTFSTTCNSCTTCTTCHTRQVGLLAYLAARLAACPTDPKLALSYLRAAKRAGRSEEVERVTRDPSIAYEPHDVLALLAESSGGFADPRPIMNVCDRFEEALGEASALLLSQGKTRHLALYVQKVNPSRAPQVG